MTTGSMDYSLACMVTVSGVIGTPSITWTDPAGTTVSSSTDFTVGGVSGSGSTYTRVLVFDYLKTSQAGVYTCNAALNLETKMSDITVTVTSALINSSYSILCSLVPRLIVVILYSED